MISLAEMLPNRKDEIMSRTPKAGDDVPEGIRQELIEAIDSRNRAVSEDVRDRAFVYARHHLGMERPTLTALWEYILDRLQAGVRLRYARLDDYPFQWGYAMRKADGTKLYIKLMFDDQSRAVLLSFHD